MQKFWKPGISCVILLGLLAVWAQVFAAQTAPKAGTQPASVSGSGCVEPGVETGCLVLKDSKTGTSYNLFFTGDKPSLNTAIEFSGTAHEGPTTCMQGKPVKVSKWKQIKMQCTPPSAKEP